ncbi:MAG: chromosome partitioning protein, partial [Acidimicrobiia bacterium]|nr:chromosome partitioning protein [Acidimicrobiia bacterium]
MELQDYVKIVRNHWKLVVASVVLLLVLAGAYILAATPVYSARAELFVADSNASTPQELVEASDFTLDRVKSYVYVVDSEIVLAPVIEELDLDLTTSELAGKVSATVPTDTVVIQIRVSDTSPELAQRIANATAEQFRSVTTRLDGEVAASSTITVLNEADEPTQPIAPNRKLAVGFCLILGL